MKIKLIVSAMSLGAVLLASGCQQWNATSPFNGYTQAAPATPAQMKVDARILGSLVVLNQNEMAAATLAQRKASSPSVKNYAAWMYKAHNQNLQETQSLSQRIGIAPEKGATALALQRQGRQEMATLNRFNGKAFDRVYINAMVKDHAAALHMIDHKLKTEATNPQLRGQLEATRAHVAEHLQQARAVQREIAHG
ncbi:Predicted outer membrane protein [Legionella donaldsonii]|uniref:Predicted outer membrane protein n=1 Tax=Legionella donaldsonii TaxID=45060 RepID=A0A378J504_9GAMM|nr:DUF4142 domain-containing protein [Legionella donaldsonii]STX42569.1 Predicted outer membrane protein [Legionella donaldsonii]